MKLTSVNAKKQFQFHPAGENGRSRDFAVIPRHMIEDADKIETPRPWNRVVAFGIVAQIAKVLYEKGVTCFKPAEGRLRDNSFEGDEGEMIASYEIVCSKFAGKEAEAIEKELKKAMKKVPSAA